MCSFSVCSLFFLLSTITVFTTNTYLLKQTLRWIFPELDLVSIPSKDDGFDCECYQPALNDSFLRNEKIQFATINMKTNATFHGAQALISIHNPKVTEDQYSMAQIWIQNGPPDELNSIQAGWAVHPQLYGNHQTYMTVRWTADGFRKTGCYNTDCPGFVQVHPTICPGQPFRNTSVMGGPQYQLEVQIMQDQAFGNWWLFTNGTTKVGYWPKEIFTYLANGASVIRYGGSTKASTAGQSPPMGSGYPPSNDYHRVCYFVRVKLAGPDYKLADLTRRGMFRGVDTTQTACYGVYYFGYQSKELGQTFSFGGPGGDHCGSC